MLTLWTVLALAGQAGEPETFGPSPRPLEAAVADLVENGLDLERVRLAYNYLGRSFLDQNPTLRPAVALLGVAERFETLDDLKRSVERIRRRLRIDPGRAWVGRMDEWFRRGRVPLDEAAFVFLTQGEAWRRSPEPPPRFDAMARRGPAVGASLHAGETGRESRAEGPLRSGSAEEAPGRVPTGRVRVTPASLTAALMLLEDFVAGYGSGAAEERAGERLLHVVRRGLRPQGARDFRAVASPDDLQRGFQHLLFDLAALLVGVDPSQSRERVDALPDGGWAIAFGGYLREAPALPLHGLWTDAIQLALKSRADVVWLRETGDLDRILVDPEVRNLVLVGHASWQGFAYEGLSGPPAETLARLVVWARSRVEDLAPLVDRALAGGDARPLAGFVSRELDLGWKRWRYDDFQRLARRDGFRRKERVVLYGCGLDGVVVEASAAEFEAVLLGELSAHLDAGRWLGFRKLEGSAWGFHPLWPRAADEFRRGLPDLLERVTRRLDRPLAVREAEDFLELIAVEHARFAGNAWIHDFLEHPEGQGWRPREDVRSISRRLRP
jgi:hypothetical protein